VIATYFPATTTNDFQGRGVAQTFWSVKLQVNVQTRNKERESCCMLEMVITERKSILLVVKCMILVDDNNYMLYSALRRRESCSIMRFLSDNNTKKLGI
jgi:hypothetical protein